MNLILIKQKELSSNDGNSSSNATNGECKPLSVTLNSKDERAKHILHHLNKKSGDTVSVGIIGGSIGKATVVYDEAKSNGSNGSCGEANNDNQGIADNATNSTNAENTTDKKDTPSKKSKNHTKTKNNNPHEQPQTPQITLILAPQTLTPPPPNLPQITLLLALPFPARLKSLLPIISSFVHVTRIILVRGALSNPEYCKTRTLHPEVYQELIEKGMSQGGRTRGVDVDVCVDVCVGGGLGRGLLERLGVVPSRRGPCNGSGEGGGEGAIQNGSCGVTTEDDGIARIFLDCGDEEIVPPPVRDVVLKQCRIKPKTNTLQSKHESLRTSQNSQSLSTSLTPQAPKSPQTTQTPHATHSTQTTQSPQTPQSTQFPSNSTQTLQAIMAVGPERGWTQQEASLFTNDCGFHSATLGSSILRVDTAVIAGLGIVSAALDELYSLYCLNEGEGGEGGGCSKRQRVL